MYPAFSFLLIYEEEQKDFLNPSKTFYTTFNKKEYFPPHTLPQNRSKKK